MGRQMACSLFSASVFLMGIVRDFIFTLTCASYPSDINLVLPGIILFVFGTVLVLSSMIRLGVHGTYLGDYFGIFKQKRVVGFPFNLFEHPMYTGSSCCFLGTALIYSSLVGVMLSAWVFIVYSIAASFEGPFTDQIYKNK